MKIVQDFYAKLHEKQDIDKEKQKEFLKRHMKMRLEEEQKKELNEPITVCEIVEAIKKQKKNKTPGPDGIPAEFYKMFEDVLQESYKSIVENIQGQGTLPKSWTKAIVSLIHKENSDPKEIRNYRPISLLNVDYKIYATILATRLRRILMDTIHQGQKEFVPKGYMRSNLRMVLNILEFYEAHPERQLAFIFLDAEKAFDNVSWEFLLEMLTTLQVREL